MISKDHNEGLKSFSKLIENEDYQGAWHKIYENCSEILSQEHEVLSESMTMQDLSFSSISTIHRLDNSSSLHFNKDIQLDALNISQFRTFTIELFKEHNSYRKVIKSLRETLQDIIASIHEKLLQSYSDFSYFSDFSEDPLEETVYMSKFIQNTISKIINSESKYTQYEETIRQMKIENIIVLKNNEELLRHIDERKIYTEKLKQKINDLRIENRNFIEREEQTSKILQNYSLPEDDTYLKNYPKEDLISLIQTLMLKITKESTKETHLKLINYEKERVSKSVELKRKSGSQDSIYSPKY